MDIATEKFFFSDDKYQNIINELESRGWVRVYHTQFASATETSTDEHCSVGSIEKKSHNNHILTNIPIIPSQCSFMWLNLSQVKFPSVFDRFVNHFRGSQNMSNKVYMLNVDRIE